MSAKKFVILLFELRRFKVAIDVDCNIPELRQLRDAFERKTLTDDLLKKRLSRERFDGFLYQIEDPDLGNEKRDLEDEDVLLNAQKVFVIISPAVGCSFDSSASLEALTAQNGNGPSPESLNNGHQLSYNHLGDFFEQGILNVGYENGETNASTSGFSEAAAANSSNDSSEASDTETELPNPFPLPELSQLPESVQSALVSGEPLHPNVKSSFVRIIARLICLFKKTPSPEEYTMVCEQICQKWPSLRSEDGSSGIRDLRKKIITRMKIERHVERKSLEGGASQPQRIRKVREDSDGNPIKRRRRTTLKRSKGPHQEFIDEEISHEEMEGHRMCVAQLQNEEDPLSLTSFKLMAETFNTRRFLIVQGQSISEILSEYPPLRNRIQLITEFERIVGDDCMIQRIKNNWTKLVPGIIELSRKEQNQFIKKELRLYDSLKEPDIRIAGKLVLRVLPRMLFGSKRFADPENYVFQICEERCNVESAISKVPGFTLPFLVETEKKAIHVILERRPFILIEDGNLEEALAVLMAAFYVFNLPYPEQAEGVFLFLQHCVMELPDKVTEKLARLRYLVQALNR